MTSGKVQVDGFEVPGNATIFSGSRITAENSKSNLQFADGTSAVLQSGATVTVYRDHSVLQQGVAMQREADKHSVAAGELNVSGATPHAVALVGMKDPSHVEVGAQAGEVDVWTSGGSLVAKIEPGSSLSFDVGQADAAQQKVAALCGDLDENYLLTDVFSNVNYKLQGAGLDSFVKHSVRVKGILAGPPAGNAPQIVNVTEIEKEKGPCNKGPGAAPSAIGGISKTGLALLIVVVAGGTLIRIGVAGGLSSGSSAPPVTPATP